jgi:hypothetical protein
MIVCSVSKVESGGTNMRKEMKAVSASLVVLAVATSGAAVECLSQDATFPDYSTYTSIMTGSCGSPGTNRTKAAGTWAFSSGPLDPEHKAVMGEKLAGLQTSYVNGVQSNNTAITGCSVTVNDPADGQKYDNTGCLNAAEYRLRMFD